MSTFTWTLKWGSFVFAPVVRGCFCYPWCGYIQKKAFFIMLAVCVCCTWCVQATVSHNVTVTTSSVVRFQLQYSQQKSIPLRVKVNRGEYNRGELMWCLQFLHPLQTSGPNMAAVLHSNNTWQSDTGTTRSISDLEMCQLFIFLFCLQDLPHNQWTETWNYCNQTQDNMYTVLITVAITCIQNKHLQELPTHLQVLTRGFSP